MSAVFSPSPAVWVPGSPWATGTAVHFDGRQLLYRVLTTVAVWARLGRRALTHTAPVVVAPQQAEPQTGGWGRFPEHMSESRQRNVHLYGA